MPGAGYVLGRSGVCITAWLEMSSEGTSLPNGWGTELGIFWGDWKVGPCLKSDCPNPRLTITAMSRQNEERNYLQTSCFQEALPGRDGGSCELHSRS